jgi:hypothetical protein
MKLMHSRAGFAAATLATLLAPGAARACACGCDIFDVGGTQMMPMAKGGEIYVEYNYMDQSRNWSGNSSASAANNSDKEIRTNFLTLGATYTIDQNWGVIVEVPVWNRYFRTENDAGTGVDTFNHTAIGDVRLMGVYTGLSKEMSTGIIFGVKLPTGDWRYAGFDRDTEIGTGSTNLLLGGYHTGALSRDGAWGYFVHALWDFPVATQGGYRPGQEIDAAAGVVYNGWTIDGGRIAISPLLQVLAGARAHDSGPASNSQNSGYERVLLSPGVEVAAGNWKLYGDVELPVYQHVVGNQLTAPALFKVVASRTF